MSKLDEDRKMYGGLFMDVQIGKYKKQNVKFHIWNLLKAACTLDYFLVSIATF